MSLVYYIPIRYQVPFSHEGPMDIESAYSIENLATPGEVFWSVPVKPISLISTALLSSQNAFFPLRYVLRSGGLGQCDFLSGGFEPDILTQHL